MNWRQIKTKDGQMEPHAIESDCGQFTIARVYNSLIPLYCLWRKQKSGERTLDFSALDIDEVKRYAVEHPDPYIHEVGDCA